MKNMKYFKATIATLLASGTVYSMVLMSGCGRKYNEDDVDNIIKAEDSFDRVLDSVSENSQIDENLTEFGYKEMLNDYVEARKNGLTSTSDPLEKLGYAILKSSTCELLQINVNDIKDFEIRTEKKHSFDGDYTYAYCDLSYYQDHSEIVNGNIEVNSRRVIERTYELKDEARDMGINYTIAKEKKVGIEQSEDKIFKAYQRFLLTSGKVDNSVFGGKEISFDYDDAKVDQFVKSKKK